MKPLLPILNDESSITSTAIGLERQVRGMEKALNQFQPAVSLTPEGRLMYGLTEDPNAQTCHLYPRTYAKPLLDDGADSVLRLGRVRRAVTNLATRLRPFTVQHLPGPDDTSLQGHAIPLGFAAAQGCDVNWNGERWQTTAGLLPLSVHLANHRDVVLPAADFSPGTGLLYLAFDVKFEADGLVTIIGGALRFAEQGGTPESTSIALDPRSGSWSDGTVISPLAWCIAPSNEQAAPVVIPMGNGQFPTSHSFMRPFSAGGISPLDE